MADVRSGWNNQRIPRANDGGGAFDQPPVGTQKFEILIP
jgi:hypothetical protein